MPPCRVRTPTVLAGLLALALPGCVTRALWSDAASKVSAIHAAEFRVAAVGSWNEETTDLSVDAGVVLCVAAHGDKLVPTPNDLPAMPQMLLFPADAPTRDAIVALLTQEPLGPLDRRVVEVDWQRTPLGEIFATAQVDLGGELAPGVVQRLDTGAAAALLDSPRAVSRARLLTAGAGAQVEAAERVDWRLLLPFDTEGRGEVLAGIRDVGAGADSLDLLVRVGDGDRGRVVRVPARLAPMLGRLRRDSLLFDRYRLQATCRAALSFPKVSVANAAAPKRPTTLALTSRFETMEAQIGLPAKILLTPFAATADVLLWFLRHGPLGPILPPLENPNPGPVRAVRADGQ
jgi:hypothetical protein